MATEHFCLRWNNHQSTLISVFDNLLERETLVDCTLAADGRYLKAHKVVLSACSPFLGMLLTQHYDKHPIIILKDVKFDELKAMLDYMYRGEVNISQEQLSAFLKAAESLQIKGLSDSGAEELNSLHSNRPPSSNSTTSATNEDPQSPVAVVESGSPSSRNKRKIDKDDLLDGEVSSKHSASDSSVLDGRSVPCVSDSPSTAKNLNLMRIKSEPIVEVSEQMSTTSSVDESSESAMFSRPGPSNESGPSNKGSSWGPSMDNSWDGVQVTPGQGITPNSQESENAAHWFVPLIHLASPTTPTDKNLDKKHSCLTCGKSYQLASSLYTHEKYQCNKEPQFSCPYCPHKTKLKGNLKAHIGFKHANLPRPF